MTFQSPALQIGIKCWWLVFGDLITWLPDEEKSWTLVVMNLILNLPALWFCSHTLANDSSTFLVHNPVRLSGAAIFCSLWMQQWRWQKWFLQYQKHTVYWRRQILNNDKIIISNYYEGHRRHCVWEWFSIIPKLWTDMPEKVTSTHSSEEWTEVELNQRHSIF
jgi:hypothetical protein